ncbi:MAG TPA: fatty acid desaturase [Puia sp.]|nr:fatty acid desaturase [Puia sp.]
MQTIKEKIVVPKYISKDANGFYAELKSRVNLYFRQNGLSRKGGRKVAVKTAVIFILYITFYGLMLSNRFSGPVTLLFAIFFGLTNVLIVFNVAHDAAHHALFENERLNRLFSYGFNLVGANAYLWNITHNQIHHAFPNVGDYDGDIHQQAPFIRISPTVPKKWYHRFQPYYATFFYLIYSIFLLFQKDYQDFNILPKKDSRLLLNKRHPRAAYFVFFFSKLFYYAITIVIPFFVIRAPWWQFLGGYFIVHLCMSVFLASVLIPVHMVDEAPFAVEQENLIGDSWVHHVFENTTDYARDSRLANLFFGGQNTHLVHHLLPDICHIHHISVSAILEQTAREYGFEYRTRTMFQAIASHYRLLKRMSR